MMKFIAIVLLLFSIECSAQLTCGVTYNPLSDDYVVHYFKKQPYGVMALSQKIGGGFGMTNIFFKKNAGLAINLSTDTTASLGLVYNTKIRKVKLQPYTHWKTTNSWNCGVRTDVPITERITFLNFTGYTSQFYCRCGILYKFE